jgi:hypothetical protein
MSIKVAAGYKRIAPPAADEAPSYHGAVRVNGVLVWECDHLHAWAWSCVPRDDDASA